MKSLAILMSLALYAPQVEATIYEMQAVSPPQVGFVRSYARHIKAQISHQWEEHGVGISITGYAAWWGLSWYIRSLDIHWSHYIDLSPPAPVSQEMQLICFLGIPAVIALFGLIMLNIREAGENERYARMMWGIKGDPPAWWSKPEPKGGWPEWAA